MMNSSLLEGVTIKSRAKSCYPFRDRRNQNKSVPAIQVDYGKVSFLSLIQAILEDKLF